MKLPTHRGMFFCDRLTDSSRHALVLFGPPAQPDLPATVIRMPYLPVNPMRVFQVDMVVLRNAYELTSGLFALAAYNWIKYKIDTGRRRFCRVEQRVFRSVSYDVGPGSGPSVRSWRKVDVYVPVLLKDSSGNVIGVKRSRNVEDRLDEGCPGSPLVGGASPAADVCAGSPLAPVIIYIFGGAWISGGRDRCSRTPGSKGMFSPMARTLSDDGYVTVIPNYTLYPQGKIRDMVADVRACITWTHQNIRTYHGDPDKIYIMGHGSGAHLAALTVIQDSVAAAGVLPDSLRWDRDGRDVLAVPPSNEPGTVAGNGNGNEAPSQSPSPSPLPVCGLVLFAGVFDLTYQYAYEVKRGIEEISGLARCV
ncbi:MAG: Alpha/Beta hydrolase protein, partial [Olpidium bornovanus]